MKKYLVRFLAIIGGITVISFMSLIVTGIFVWMGKEEIPDKIILELDFEKGIFEYLPDEPTARMMFEEHLKLVDIIEGLKTASEDKRVAGLVARIGRGRMGFAQIQEMRNAIISFRSKGKTAIAYADTFGEFGPGNGSYYLATAFDRIYLQPSGDIGLTGLIMETVFLKGTLDKLAVTPRMDHRHEYKNAMNIFTEEKYTAPHEEALEQVMESLFEQIAKHIAQARNIPEESIRSLIDKGPFIGEEAIDASLIDELAYRDKVYDDTEAKAGEDTSFLSLAGYLKRLDQPPPKGDAIALIYGVGTVRRGKSRYDPLSGETSMGSKSVTSAFRSAIEDDKVKAVIFRINSPGGSYVASDSIWRETVRAREAGKPVIVSMGDVAGSGGYFVAMAADKIVAQPGTITGSIGVLGGKMVTSGFWEKLGISWDEIHTSKNSDIWTSTNDYTPEQWNRLQDFLDRIYEDFTTKVAEGRGMPKDKVMEIAKGRIWTGQDAKELGLVDELGGFPDAIRLARQAAGISDDSEIYLKMFPKKKSLSEILLEKMSETSDARVPFKATVQVLKELQPIVRSAKKLGIAYEQHGFLSMPYSEAFSSHAEF
ncbi:MAG: signal peptide peptidase SppA [Desulfobacterales bacterium]|nr:signal peptide peptidase SppA [Desulfobacterales bacterium]